ncbi:mobilization protein [Pedobacter panaciterrae]|uniref:mobilization protein n=1 Tax=Pedobacter panaciterrae TaxID=363849 RepID=UPI00155DAE7F|nr:mobilization protein [Pedobacter panaciterrae]NQX56924.1 mobilization protein [Pedobacter panaciterrae]
MPRKKSANPQELLTHFVRTRVTHAVYCRLEKIQKSGDCHTVGEVARKLLSKEKITVFYKDMTLNAAMEELALIRKELRSIGININQVTKAFHSDKRASYQIIHVKKLAELYKTVEAKTAVLLSMINQLAEKWLPRS